MKVRVKSIENKLSCINEIETNLVLLTFALRNNRFMIERIHKINVMLKCNIIIKMPSEFDDAFCIVD